MFGNREEHLIPLRSHPVETRRRRFLLSWALLEGERRSWTPNPPSPSRDRSAGMTTGVRYWILAAYS